MGMNNWQQVMRRRVWLFVLLGVVVCMLGVWLGQITAVFGPIVDVDINQPRVNSALPPPTGHTQIQQSFYSRWDGLREIEIVFARSGEPDPDENGILNLQLLDDNGDLVARRELVTSSLAHNQTYNFRFPLQSHSAGRSYLLQISGNADNAVSVWGYSLDVYQEGELSLINGENELNGLITAKELRFTTRYQLTWTDSLIALGTRVYYEGLLLLLALAFIPLPGVIMLLFFRKEGRRWDVAAWWGVAFALGVAGWPLIWYGWTLLGGRWRGWSLWVIFFLGWGTALFIWLITKNKWQILVMLGSKISRNLSRERQHVTNAQYYEENDLPSNPWKWDHLFLLILLLLSLSSRLLAVRDLSFPPWVDSSRHALITATMAEQGRTPAGYEPLLPVDGFPYHYGFHTISTSLLLMSGWPLHRLLLFLGQFLNGLLPLTVYTSVWLMTRRRGPGLAAAFLVAFPFFFPAYYATWGRMTQLAAMFIMPVLLALTWLLVRGGRRWRHHWWTVALLAAGLFLLHFRVFAFYLPFAALVWGISLGRNGRWLAASGGLSLLLLGPRIAQLLAVTEPVELLDSNIPDYNRFPFSYVETGWERGFIGLAMVALLLLLVPFFRRKRWTALPMTLVGWVAILFILLSGERFGLPETWLFNLNSMYITLFLPLAVFLAVTSGHLWNWLQDRNWLVLFAGYLLTGGILGALFLFGVRQQISILNPQTILAHSQDLFTLEWVEQNLPPDATLAVNSWLWLGAAWAGSDGGAWVVPMTGRLTTTPPVDYIYDLELYEYVTAFNQSATSQTDWSKPDAANWLKQQGVTHVFIGARGGFFDPAVLARNPKMELVFSRDGSFIFALIP